MAGFSEGAFGGGPIEAGECATAGVAALLAAKKDPEIWRALDLGPRAIILLIGTEGATDPLIYETLLSQGQKT
mgnify:CR=1 FL=1